MGVVSSPLYLAKERNMIENLTKEPIWGRNNKFTYLSIGGDKKFVTLSELDDFDFDLDEYLEMFIMKPTRDCLELISLFNRDYRRYLPQPLGITKKFAWSRGTYDSIKAGMNKLDGQTMRACGMDSIFRRREQAQYVISNTRKRLQNIERLRMLAKQYSISKDFNIDNAKTLFNDTLQYIKEKTQEANECHKGKLTYKQYYNFSSDGIDKLTLYTFVKLNKTSMIIVDENNHNLATTGIKETYLMFRRDILDILDYFNLKMPVHRQSHFMSKILKWGAYPHGMECHPYINLQYVTRGSSEHTFYHFKDDIRDNYSGGIHSGCWGNLCLSAFDGDVTGSLVHHKYTEAGMSMRFWNQVFNIHLTNPYHPPHKFMTDLSNRDGVKGMGYNKSECGQIIYRNLTAIETDKNTQNVNSYLSEENTKNYVQYYKAFNNVCKERKCSLMDECPTYEAMNRGMALFESENILEILQDMFLMVWDYTLAGYNTEEEWFYFLNSQWFITRERLEDGYVELQDRRYFQPKKTKSKTTKPDLDVMSTDDVTRSMETWAGA